ncbi:MAG TPA: presqualene diphosphate synthase HpnD [Magnetospirillum sp.]|jgi:phytoene synthase|nr:presqualene diphosphate synthase HpnD [Magnetospirillum sp.]
MNLIDLGDAQSQAAAKAKAASSSFYWAMRALPTQKRLSMYAIYAFCREVDDITDSSLPAEEKLVALERWKANVERLFRPVSTPAFLLEAPLRRAIELHGLRRRDFLAVIDGMVMDAERAIVAPSTVELDLYCDRVAGAVGRLSVRVFGMGEAEGEALAGALGRALQLTNILRDIGEDAKLGRLYLPDELLAEHGILIEDDLADVLAHPALPAACFDLSARARRHFAEAMAVAKRCPRDQVRPAMMMACIYQALLGRLEADGWRHPHRRVGLSKLHKLWLLARHSWGTR